ncbi:MAG: DUF427 domain-containing protein [Chloroflexota bacterium]
MAKAIWNDKIIAESDKTIIVEGNIYFPPDSINKEFLSVSTTHTRCPWKGVASYHTIKVDDKLNQDAAWFYPNPSEAAGLIKDYIAFWRGVKVVLD